MAREQRHTARRRRSGWVRGLWVEVLVLSLLAFAVVGYRYDLGERWFGWGPVDPVAEPTRVLAPQGLRLPETAPAPAVAAQAEGVAVDAAAVAAALRPQLRGRVLGPGYTVLVTDLRSGEEVFQRGAERVVPASTTKILTAVAALEVLGAERRFETSVRWLPQQRRLVLVGGGDPFLGRTPASSEDLYPARADLATLARAAAAALRRDGVDTRGVRLGFDDSLFSGPRVNPTWLETYLVDITSGISALWVDQAADDDGFGFASDPAAQAARVFGDLLRAQGVRPQGAPQRLVAPEGAQVLAAVESATVGEIVEQVLSVSDNQGAEVLAHHVGLAVRGEGSFEAGAAATLEVLRGLGVPTRGEVLYDGSGLSRQNALSGEVLTAALRLADAEDRPELRHVLTGLPVAGFSGSMAARPAAGPEDALGRVRAKTGTLAQVHGLAGVVDDASGARMAFVAVAAGVRPARDFEARLRIDRIAAALGACSCGVGS